MITGQGMTLSSREGLDQNVIENATTHAVGGWLNTTLNNTTGAISIPDLSGSKFEYDYYARAVVDKAYSYNLESNPNFLTANGGALNGSAWMNKYWSGYTNFDGSLLP